MKALRRHWWRLLISIAWDLMDYTIGRLPVLGTVMDLIGGFLGVMLWGTRGWYAFAEVIDLTEQIDAYIPTLTIIGVTQMYKENRW